MKCSRGISNFFEEISSLSLLLVFLYFFALIIEKGFLIFSCYSLDSAFKCVYLYFSPLSLASLLFSSVCKASSDHHFAFLHFFFLEMVLITACKIGRLWKAPLCIAVKLTNSGHSKDKKSGWVRTLQLGHLHFNHLTDNPWTNGANLRFLELKN